MAKIMTAKYRGRCDECRAPIAKGARILYQGRGNPVLHAHCAEAVAAGPDDYSNINPATGARMSNNARVVVTRFAGGGTITRNSRGRCIDAPCCGCCT